MATVAVVTGFPSVPGGEPSTTASRYPSAAVAVRPTVIGGETTSAAPPTIRGYVKKKGLWTPPVRATSKVATVMATDPSTPNLAAPSASAGSRSCTTSTNMPVSASRTRMAGSLAGQSPVTATIVVVARRKTQLTIL